MGYRVSRLLVAVCLSLVMVLAGVALPANAAAPFTDVPASDPAYTAIGELASRGIIRGCDQAANRFCPSDPTLRAQMAALIARAMQWDSEDHGNQFADRCDPVQGCIDSDLWRNVGTLQFYGVAKGFDAISYGPHVNVAQQQVILFISRAMVKKGAWQRQPDNASIYPNLPRGSAAERLDAQDVATYVHYVGAAPDTQSSTTWGSYAQASTRAWFARALWQVLARFPVGPTPSASPIPSPTGATQFKAQMVAAVDHAYPDLVAVVNQCPYTGSIQCARLYNQGQDALNDFSNTLLTIKAPAQCGTLHLQIGQTHGEAQAWMGNEVTRNAYGIDTNDAAGRAFEAIKWHQAIRWTIVNDPGTCR